MQNYDVMIGCGNGDVVVLLEVLKPEEEAAVEDDGVLQELQEKPPQPLVVPDHKCKKYEFVGCSTQAS